MTNEAKMIVSCIARMKQQESYSVIIQVLRGEDSDYIRYCDYNQLSTHGIMKTIRHLNSVILWMNCDSKDF